jgi:hypothetical protein
MPPNRQAAHEHSCAFPFLRIPKISAVEISGVAGIAGVLVTGGRVEREFYSNSFVAVNWERLQIQAVMVPTIATDSKSSPI